MELADLVRRNDERRGSLNLTERTYEDIRAAILRGQFAAGSVGNLRGFVRVMRVGTERSGGHLHQVLAEHEAIVDALERRDADAALAALDAHLQRANYRTPGDADPNG